MHGGEAQVSSAKEIQQYYGKLIIFYQNLFEFHDEENIFVDVVKPLRSLSIISIFCVD